MFCLQHKVTTRPGGHYVIYVTFIDLLKEKGLHRCNPLPAAEYSKRLFFAGKVVDQRHYMLVYVPLLAGGMNATYAVLNSPARMG